MIDLMDPQAYRAQARERWEGAAAGWGQSREAMERVAEPVVRWMLDAARLQPGQTVLEVAAGPGDVGLAAARRVAPDGKAIVTDGAQAMVEVARLRAQELGIENVELRQMEAEWLDLPTASVDAVLSRWGYMLLADPEAALRDARRVLRPGGRIALAVWDAPQHNPWLALAQGELRRLELVEAPDPDEPGPFALGGDGRVEELLQAAGFHDPVVEGLDLVFQAPDLDAWWEQQLRTSTRLPDVVRGLSPAEHYALRDAFDAVYAPFVGAEGAVSIPARTLVAAADA